MRLAAPAGTRPTFIRQDRVTSAPVNTGSRALRAESARARLRNTVSNIGTR
jgi:hypothetical protein